MTFDPHEEDGPGVAAIFTAGHWNASHAPREWQLGPAQKLENKEFHAVFQRCLARLPERLALVFTLREIEGCEAQEICDILNMPATNLWVMLYRARTQLRTALEREWFRTQK